MNKFVQRKNASNIYLKNIEGRPYQQGPIPCWHTWGQGLEAGLEGELGCTELGRGRGRTGKAAAFLSICMHQIWGPDKMGSVAAPTNMFKSQDRVWDMAG